MRQYIRHIKQGIALLFIASISLVSVQSALGIESLATNVKGKPFIKGPDGKITTITNGFNLQEGDIIYTGFGSSLQLKIDEDFSVQIDPSSMVQLHKIEDRRPGQESREPNIVFKMGVGKIKSISTNSIPHKIKVQTPATSSFLGNENMLISYSSDAGHQSVKLLSRRARTRITQRDLNYTQDKNVAKVYQEKQKGLRKNLRRHKSHYNKIINTQRKSINKLYTQEAKLRTRTHTTRSQLAQLQTQRSQIQNTLTDSQQRLQNMQYNRNANQSMLQKYQSEHTRIHKKQQSNAEKMHKIERKIKKISKELHHLNAKIAKKHTAKHAQVLLAKTNLLDANQQILTNLYLQAMERDKKLQDLSANIQQKQERLKDITQNIKQQNRTIKSTQHDLQKQTKKITNIRNKIQDLTTQHRTLTEEIKKQNFNLVQTQRERSKKRLALINTAHHSINTQIAAL